VSRRLPWRACHKPTFSRRRKLHATPFDPVRRRARKPAGVAGHQDELIRHYTFSETDLSVIRQRRGDANRLGFAVQLVLPALPWHPWASMSLRFRPCCNGRRPTQGRPVESWDEYGQREQTRREHLVELQTVFGFQPFTMSHYRQAVHA
jgi:hypothetical protein